MEDQNIPPQPTPVPGASTDPVPTPVPQPAPIAAPTPVPTSYAGGGDTNSGNSVSRFFEGVTVSDVFITGFAIVAFCYVIKYYKKKIERIKEERTKTATDLEEVKANVQNMLGGEYKRFA